MALYKRNSILPLIFEIVLAFLTTTAFGYTFNGGTPQGSYTTSCTAIIYGSLADQCSHFTYNSGTLATCRRANGDWNPTWLCGTPGVGCTYDDIINNNGNLQIINQHCP